MVRVNWEDRLARREAELDRKLDAMDAVLDRACGDPPAKRSSAGGTASPVPTPPPDAGFLAANPAWAGLYVDKPAAYFAAAQSEILQICAYVFHAPHVTGNAQYAEVAMRTAFACESEDTGINAYATHGPEGKRPEIKVLGGAVAFARLAGAMRALSGAKGWRRLNAVWPAVGQRIAATGGALPPEAARELLGELNGEALWRDETLVRRAVAHAAGMLAGIIAHELGHLALGHTLGRAANLEVSRNQEREADSFASSVISTSVFSDPLVEGMLLWELAWAWSEHAGGSEVATTHPLARERLLDFIRANETVAAGLGITPENVTELMPE